MKSRITAAIVAWATLVAGLTGYAQSVRFVASSGTVTDSLTGLMWVQRPVASQRYWSDNLAICENLVYAGFSDWRLPNIKEALTIFDLTRAYPALDTNVFETVYNSANGTGPRYEASSTTTPAGPTSIFCIDVATGAVAGCKKDANFVSDTSAARCVR